MKIVDTMARWQAQEDAVRARLAATAGYRRPNQAEGRTGMEMFEAIFAGELPRPPIGDTLELKLNTVRPLTEAVPLARAEGMLVHAGRQVATAEGRLVSPDGKLNAHATTTCLIFDRTALAVSASPSLETAYV
jgi:acyl-coenzyme A thioesterase PaaI-like protein